MKKIIFLFHLLVGVSLIGMAQTQTYSLEQAMEAGIQNRFDIQSREYNVNLAENQTQKSKKAWIPKIEGEGNIQYNTQLSPTYVPEGFAGFDEAGLLSLGAKNQSTFGLALTQPIFKPGIQTDIEIAKTQQQLSREQVRGYKTDVKNKIATAYLNVLLKELQYKIAKNEESRLEKYATLTEGAYQNGTVIKNNYLRIKLDYQNAQVKTQTVHQDYQLALDHLKYEMNLSAKTQMILTDSIDQMTLDPLPQQNNLAENRTEIKQLLLEQNENALRLKKVKQYALPTVSLSGYYGQWYQNQNFRYGESKWWAPQSYIGLNISIPITANFTNKNKLLETKIRQEQLIMDMEQKKADINFEIQKATSDIQNSRRNMQTTIDNYQLSQTIYQNQQQQFEMGAFLFRDLLDTEKSLHEAEQMYLRSVYDYMMSLLEYQKAVGIL